MGRTWTVFRKEVRETIRDRRTLLIMIVVPVLLYPALMVVSEQLALFGIRQLEAEPSRVAVLGDTAGADELETWFEGEDDLDVVDLEGEDPETAVRGSRVAAVAIVRDAPSLDLSESAEEASERIEPIPEPLTRGVTIVFDAADDRSRRGRDLLAQAIGRWEERVLRRRLSGEGLPAAFANPVSVADSSVASPDEIGGYALGRFLPMLLIVITLLGTFYPAIDLAAGEKERGTLETLLTAPVPSKEIVAGKFLTVAAVGVIAAALNLGSMLLTFQSGLFRFGAALDVDFSLPIGRVAIIFLTLVPLAVLFGSLFLGVAVRARSFKEAQNALTPLYMLALMPALLPLFPGIEFTPPLALVPIAGVALFFRELMGGSVPLLLGLSAIGSTIAYAWAALAFAASSFGSEDVLFGGEGGSEGRRGPISGLFRRSPPAEEAWADPLEALDGSRVLGIGGRPERQGATPTAGQALLFVGLVAVLFFYLGAPLQIRWLERGLFATEWLLLFLPAVLFVALWRFDPAGTFSLRRPRGRQVTGALLMIAGSTPIAWLLAWLQSLWLPIPWELVEGLDELVRADSLPRLAWLLVLIALTPAICEEAVFRGILLAGSRRMTMARAVVLNGLVFGAFHVSFETVFRLLPTAWLGLVLAWAAWHTRSIWISSLMHFVNNGSIVVLAAIPWARELMGGPDFRPPPLLMIPAVVSFVLGARMILNAHEEPRQPNGPPTGLAPLTTELHDERSDEGPAPGRPVSGGHTHR
jgi:sodium transport system permease protein